MKKEYADVCRDFKHFYGISIEEGKHCLACQHYWQKDSKKWHSWECEIPEQKKRKKMFRDSLKKGQLCLSVGMR